MTHAEHGTLLSYLDGELAGSEVERLKGHLAACSGCRRGLEDLRALVSEVSGALGLISSEVPVSEARARLDHRRRAGAPLPRPRPWSFAAAGMLKAAAIVLALAGAASAAIPGTPLNRLAASLLARVTGGAEARTSRVVPDTPAPTVPEAAPQEPAGASAGVVLSAREGQLQISVHTVEPSARIDVRLVEGSGGIRALTDTDNVRFRTGPGYVEVFDVRSGLVIEIPRSLRAATVEVNGRVFWRKEGAAVR